MTNPVPALITAGTTVKFLLAFTDYPAGDGWAYTFALAGPASLSKAGTPSGDAFEVTLTATETAGLPHGGYRYSEFVAKGGEVFEVGRGVLEVQPDLAAAQGNSALSHAERTLLIIEAALEGRLPNGMETYQIAGRAVSKMKIKELMELRGHYAALVWRQRNPGKLGPTVKVTFGGTE
jgi:hypothetical protein